MKDHLPVFLPRPTGALLGRSASDPPYCPGSSISDPHGAAWAALSSIRRRGTKKPAIAYWSGSLVLILISFFPLICPAWCAIHAGLLLFGMSYSSARGRPDDGSGVVRIPDDINGTGRTFLTGPSGYAPGHPYGLVKIHKESRRFPCLFREG